MAEGCRPTIGQAGKARGEHEVPGGGELCSGLRKGGGEDLGDELALLGILSYGVHWSLVVFV